MYKFEQRKEKQRQKLLENDEILQNDIDTMNKEGYLIIKNVLSPSQIEQTRKECRRLLQSSATKKAEKFTGVRNECWSLISKSRLFDAIVLNERVLKICDYYLAKRYLLSSCALVELLKITTKQVLHQDGGGYLYQQLPSMASNGDINPLRIGTMWAITDFTETNGATQIVPRSHLWPRQREVDHNRDTIRKAVMPAGSVMLYFGTLYHGGGKNEDEASRIGLGVTYIQPWLRPQEQDILAVPQREIHRMPKRLQAMIGYELYPFGGNIGMVDGKHPAEAVLGLSKL